MEFGTSSSTRNIHVWQAFKNQQTNTSSSMTIGELLSPEGTGLGVKSANSARRASRLAPGGDTLSHRFV